MAAHDDIDWDKIAEMDPTVHLMQGAGIPLTRENYIGVRWGEPGTMDYPEEWTADHEASLPAPFQKG